MMKTFFGIVVGLMLLFSNTMVQAMPPHKKTVPVFTVAVTIENKNATTPLNLQYQPSTLGGIPTPSTSSLTTSVSTNSSVLVNIPMLPGNFYLISSYDSNHFCKFNFFVRGDGLHKASRVFRQGSGVNCNISVSGKNSVTITTVDKRKFSGRNIFSKTGEGSCILDSGSETKGGTYICHGPVTITPRSFAPGGSEFNYGQPLKIINNNAQWLVKCINNNWTMLNDTPWNDSYVCD